MGTGTPLVCQFLERISRRALEKYQNSIRDYVRKRHGVYALYRGDRLYYVGLAKNLRSRLHRHLRDRHGQSWDRFSVYLTIGDRQIKELESLVLRIVRPPGNKIRGSFPKADNLLRRLGREIRKVQRREWQYLFGRSRNIEKVLSVSFGRKHSRKHPVLSRYITGPVKLRRKWKGQILRAWVKKDGSIRFKGRTYTSPSIAAKAAVKHSCNGWRFWSYERAPGDWVPLNTLKK